MRRNRLTRAVVAYACMYVYSDMKRWREGVNITPMLDVCTVFSYEMLDSLGIYNWFLTFAGPTQFPGSS